MMPEPILFQHRKCGCVLGINSTADTETVFPLRNSTVSTEKRTPRRRRRLDKANDVRHVVDEDEDGWRALSSASLSGTRFAPLRR